jgi:uncharacterized protein (UPF0210 family)
MFGTADLLKRNEELETANAKLKEEIKEVRKDYERLKDDLEKEKGILLKAMELDYKQRMIEEVAKIKEQYNQRVLKDLEGNFEKLKGSLSKLHEEGNANTRYLEKVTLKMMDAMNVNINNKQVRYDGDTEL